MRQPIHFYRRAFDSTCNSQTRTMDNTIPGVKIQLKNKQKKNNA